MRRTTSTVAALCRHRPVRLPLSLSRSRPSLRSMSTSASLSDASARLTLPSGSKMPYIGLGLWKAEQGTLADIVETAVGLGYRHFDSAADYGNEQQTGEGLQRAISKGVVKREELFITSKLWCTYHARQHVRPALERCLADLRLDYLDLFLVHFPISLEYVDFNERYPAGWAKSGDPKDSKLSPDTMRETWEAMEELLSAGLVRNIGVSNMNTSLLQDLLRYAKVKPACNQLELHPLLPSTTLVQFCQLHSIAVVAFSPFGGQSYLSIFPDSHKAPSLLQSPAVQAIATAHKKTTGQVLLRWSLQRGVAAIPKSTNVERLKENLAVFDFELSEKEMKALNELNGGVNWRFNDPGKFAGLFCAIWD